MGRGEVQNKATANLMVNAESQELCTHINTRKRAAQWAKRDSQVLFQTVINEQPLSAPGGWWMLSSSLSGIMTSWFTFLSMHSR